jgi:AraC-like DNA-binding protein
MLLTMLDKLLQNLAVEPEPFALCKLSNGWRICLPPPPSVVMHFLLQGNGSVISDSGRRIRIAPLSAVIVPVGMAHVLETDGVIENELRIDSPPIGSEICQIIAGDPSNFDLIVACGKINARYGESIGLFDHLRDMLVIDMSSFPQAAPLFEEIFEEQAKEALGYELILSSLMMRLIIEMFRLLANDNNGELPWITALQDERMARALEFIFENPGAEHSVESLAIVAGMSRSAFAEHFSTAFSRSPINFVNHVRMERAGRMLQDGSNSIDQIASQVGFHSRSHFSQLFKKHTGHSPAEYRLH